MTEPSSRTRILLPVSAAISKEQMVAAMLPLLRFHASRLVLFHVVKKPKGDLSRGAEATGAVASAKDSLESLAEWLREQGYEVEIKVEVTGNIVHAIVNEAMRSEYSMVFMMKRKRKGGILSRFTRSVTDSVVKQAECPVVSVLL